jgi:hypothetical protein
VLSFVGWKTEFRLLAICYICYALKMTVENKISALINKISSIRYLKETII